MPEMRTPAKHRALCGQSQYRGAFGAASGSVRCQQTVVESRTTSTGRVIALKACAHAPIAGRARKGWTVQAKIDNTVDRFK